MASQRNATSCSRARIACPLAATAAASALILLVVASCGSSPMAVAAASSAADVGSRRHPALAAAPYHRHRFRTASASASSMPRGGAFAAAPAASAAAATGRQPNRPFPASAAARAAFTAAPASTAAGSATRLFASADDDGGSAAESTESSSQSSTTSTTTPTPPHLQDLGVIQPEDGVGAPCVIKVLGVGGGGGNAVNRMIQTQIEGVAFWGINTDAQALAKSLAPNVLNIGQSVTRGLGAGGDPTVGKTACEENYDDIEHICRGADMIFITAGMGGGTGSGAAPVVAEIAKEKCGCLTVGVVTKPFAFEGRKRMKQAEDAIEELRKHVDTLIVVSNDKLLRIVPDNTPVTDAFLVADDILRQGVVGISEIIIKTGLVNVDFADVRAVMKDAGTALMGVGTGVGKSRAADAAVAAISSPLLDFPISEAQRIVFNVVGGPDMGLQEINSASEVIYENAHEDANIIFGALIDEAMGDEVSITVLACDFRDGRAAVAGKKVVKEAREAREKREQAAAAMKSMKRTAKPAAGSSSSTGGGGGEDDRRDPKFYKERRQATRSPLGPDATIEETRVAITRGFKRPEATDDEDPGQKDVEKGLRKRFRGFFRRLLG